VIFDVYILIYEELNSVRIYICVDDGLYLI